MGNIEQFRAFSRYPIFLYLYSRYAFFEDSFVKGDKYEKRKEFNQVYVS